ncbi:MAG: LysR family transcriptional regulator [Pseudomonadota bacterium]
MNNWNEIRTAAAVARLGTISAAAETLGVHRATVTRHIDELEAALGAKLFQRHARGFTATELGTDLLRVADATDEQFGQLVRRAKGGPDTLSGEITVTTLEGLASYILPNIAAFSVLHPDIRVQIISTASLMKLEYGQAHVAFRAGGRPDDPDNVVRLYKRLDMALYASKAYVAAYGRPKSVEEFRHHRFIGTIGEGSRAPFKNWLLDSFGDVDFKLEVNQAHIIAAGIEAGLGIGFSPAEAAQNNPNLVEIMPTRPEWKTSIWMVTHVDLHRSAKVQAFIKHFRGE